MFAIRKNIEKEMDLAIKEWDKERLLKLVSMAKEAQITPFEIVNDILYPQLLTACKSQQTFDIMFSELLLLSDTIKAAFDILIPEIKYSKKQKKKLGTIVIGTVEGDIHDFGKNLVSAFFESSGYNIIDLGRDVPLEIFLSTSEKEHADMIAVSALMTPAITNMKRLLAMINENEMNVKTIIGGLATSMELAKDIGADAWAEDAVSGLSIVTELLKE